MTKHYHELLTLVAGACTWSEAVTAWRENNPETVLDLTGADLEGKNLNGVNFRNANLKGANLQHASMMKVRLDGADLRGAALPGAILTAATMSKETKMDSPAVQLVNVEDLETVTGLHYPPAAAIAAMRAEALLVAAS